MTWVPIGPRPDRPLVVAHRGSSATVAENTLAALEVAVDEGAEILEVDVRLTADDQPVVIHDHTLERTTDAAQRWPDRAPWEVRRHTLEEVRRLEAGRWQGEVQRVPTLAEVLDLVRRRDVGLLIETKTDHAPAHLEAVIATEVRRLEDWQDWVPARLMVCSFDHGSLLRARDLLPGVHLAYIVLALVAHDWRITQAVPVTPGLLEPGVRLDALRDRLVAYGIGYLGAAVFGEHGEPVDDLSAETIAWFREGGVEVNLITDDPDQMRSLARRGMSSILTNRPLVLAQVLGLR
jgi:glycerophosphoryl diester phosphodiesterase